MTYLEAFLSEWQHADYASYTMYTKSRETAEKELTLMAAKIDALVTKIGTPEVDMAEEDKAILVGELKYKKLKVEHLLDLMDKRLAVMARAVGQQRNMFFGGGELLSSGVEGDTLKVSSFYDALLDKIHAGIHIPLFGEMAV